MDGLLPLVDEVLTLLRDRCGVVAVLLWGPIPPPLGGPKPLLGMLELGLALC